MSPVRGNAAYDFSLFEAKDKVEEQEKKLADEKRQKPAAKPSIKPAAVLKIIATSLFVLLSLTAFLLCNVQLTSLSDEVSKAQKELNESKNEEIRLNIQLESRMSLNNVESYAVDKLGLQKIGQYQIYYLHMNNKDKIELSPKSENLFVQLINRILEYF